MPYCVCMILVAFHGRDLMGDMERGSLDGPLVSIERFSWF